MSGQNIDIQKLHLSPKPVQIVVALLLGAAIVGFGYVFSFQEQMETWNAAQEEEVRLKNDYTALSVKVANLDNLQLELQMIEKSIEGLIKQLPTTAEIPNLIQELHQAAATNGLTMTHVIPRKAEREDDNIQRLPFSISVTGSYEQLAQFMRDVGVMSRIVTLSSVNISSADEKNSSSSNNKKAGNINNKLVLTAIASTYKAIDTPKPAASSVSAATAQ